MTFECNDKKNCVPYAWKCDRVPDCPDGSDELGCGTFTEPKTKAPSTTLDEEPACRRDEFTCISGEFIKVRCLYLAILDAGRCFYFCLFVGECIPQAWVCDRQRDCPGGEDEMVCDGVNGCRTDGTQFRCRKTRECIEAHMVCDGFKNCADGSDEGVCHDPQISSQYFQHYMSRKFTSRSCK